MKMKSKDIAVCAIAVALMFCLAWLPVAAFLIPVLFVSCLYRPRHGLMIGIFAGFVCLTFALIAVAGNSDPGQIAVVCAVWVIPRALCGWLSGLTYRAAKKIGGGGKLKRFLPYILACFTGVATNTVLVISCLASLFPAMTIMGLAVGTFWWVFLLIGIGEMLATALIIPPLCLTVGKALKIGEFSPQPAGKAPEPEEGHDISV